MPILMIPLTVSPGDIRIYDQGGTYLPNSIVKNYDADCSESHTFTLNSDIHIIALTQNTINTPECMIVYILIWITVIEGMTIYPNLPGPLKINPIPL